MGYEESRIEGRNAVLEAFRSGKTIDKLYVLDGCQDGPVKSIMREARKHDTIINYVKKERLDQLSETGHHQGVIAMAASYEYATVEDILEKAKEKGIRTYLATNPVFPKVATMNRIKWAGLDAEDFELITTYEDNCYCKPNVDYYRTILEQFHLRPEECLMVGNDVEEDLAIRKLGVKTFLVTDTKENKKDLPIESDYQGSMEELFAFVESLENA